MLYKQRYKAVSTKDYVIVFGALAAALAALIFVGYGYAENIIKLFDYAGVITGKLILRVIGIFVPFIGICMGYM